MKDNHSKDKDKTSDLKEKTFKFEKYKFKAELVKWFIGSVALVLVTVIIERGFKERSAGLQEMQVYDEYVDIILKADNIEERWRLSEYFSIVTPTDRLRERWIAYKDSIENEYKLYKKLKDRELVLLEEKTASETIDTISLIDKELNLIQHKIEPFESKLEKTNDQDLASSWEEKGFSYLLSRDLEKAIEAFRNSENAFKGYHQVYEIHNYLVENKSKLVRKGSKEWNVVFKKTVTDFDYKMPDDIKTQLMTNAGLKQRKLN